MGGEDIGKNPVSEIVRGGEKPGFCENFWLQAKISEKTRFLRFCERLYANNPATDTLKPGNKELVTLSSLNKVIASFNTPFSRR